MCFIFHTVFFRHLYCFQMAFYLHLKPNDLEAAPSSRSLCSRRITKEYDLQLLVIFMVCSLRSNWRSFYCVSGGYLVHAGFPLVESCLSTSGNLLPFNECPFETSNDMTGNSTCASPIIALLPVYAPCVPRCTVWFTLRLYEPIPPPAPIIHPATASAYSSSQQYQWGETRSNEVAKPI